MKADRFFTVLTAVALAFTLSLGSVLCLASGFSLTMEEPRMLILFCALASAFCSLSLVFSRGGIPVLFAAALGLGYLYHSGHFLSQTAALITRISHVYNRAYHWGYLALSDIWQEAYCDWPLVFLAGCIILSVSHAVCRGKGAWLGILTAMFPLTLCLVVTDTVPNAACLFALMAGLSILILTAGIRSDNRRQAGQLTAMVTVPVLVFTAVLFLSFPEESYVNQAARLRTTILQWGQDIPHQLIHSAGDLASDLQESRQTQLDLSRVGPQRMLTAPVMDITSQTGGQLYLRQQDFDTYTGTGWLSDETREEQLFSPSGITDTVAIHTRSLRDTLFVPWYPAGETDLLGGAAENTANAKAYTLTRILPETAVSPETPVISSVSRYTQLPDTTREKGQSLLYGTLDTGASTREKAEAIGRLVAASARYDLAAERMPGEEGDFALWFLSSCDRGYCIHFATAATVLLRSAGIPARYVTGYLITALPGETVTVTAGHAHAWAEYYDIDTGLWHLLEATPEAEGSEEPVFTSEPIPEAPELPSEEPAVPSQSLPTEAPHPEPAQKKSISLLPFLIPVLLVLLIIFQRFARLHWKKRAFLQATPNQQALLLWQEAARLAKLLGETPPETLHGLAQKARFSQHTMTDDELDAFHQQLQASRLRLKEMPWYRQLICKYWYAAY